MKPSIDTWQTDDGLKIHCRIWENQESSNEIWIVHGMGDHGGLYEDLAREFVMSGFRVIIADHRGNGLSEGKRGHVPKFDSYLDDLGQTIDRTRTERKSFILGQSMGSLVVARYLMNRSQDFEKAILLSPMFRTTDPPPRFKLFLARMVRSFYPGLQLRAGLKSNEMTSCEQQKVKRRQDQLKHDWVSAELGLSLFEQGKLALENAQQIRIPTLIMHGDVDRITCPHASREFAGKNEIVELKIWNDMRHELHNESNNDQVFQFIFDWLLEESR